MRPQAPSFQSASGRAVEAGPSMRIALRNLANVRPTATAVPWRRQLSVLTAAIVPEAAAPLHTAAPTSAVLGALAGAVPPVPEASESADLPFYSQFPLDRKAEWRRDGKQMDALFARPDAKLIPLMRDKVLVRPVAPPPTSPPADDAAVPAAPPPLHPVLLCPAAAHADLAAASPARAFLGLDADGAPYFAVALVGDGAAAAAATLAAAAGPGAEWRGARLAGPDMSTGDASLLAAASGLMVWHAGNTFSAATGAPSLPTPGGHSRKAAAVSDGGRPDSTYPRVDPAVIMLVTSRCGGFALLGRKSEWPRDRYSTLAGFLDLAEPLEAAVVREVREEAGVVVELPSVAYAASQPWPFPRSLMVGFYARAAPASPSTPSTAGSSGSSTGSDSNGSNGNGSSSSGSSSGGGGGVGYTPPSNTGDRKWWQPVPSLASSSSSAPAVPGVPAGAAVGGFDLLPPLGRRAALDVGLFREEAEELLGPLQSLQWPTVDADELQDVRWFHRDWLRAVFRAPGGAASIAGAGRFNVPGPYSLAFRLITSWAGAVPGPAASGGGGGGGGGVPVPLPATFATIPAAADAWEGEAFPQVAISGSGTFKYILARLWDPRPEAAGRSKLLVWGDVRAPYHNDVLQKAKALAVQSGLKVTPLGGGRIKHDPEARTIDVYGYSAAFGPAPHELAAALLHRWYPLYDRDSINVSYEGY